MTSCMYGKPHPGVAYVVRSKLGKTISGLCSHHYKEHSADLLKRGFHTHSAEEMEARGEEGFTSDGREQANQELGEESHGPRPDEYIDYSRDSEKVDGLAPVATAPSGVVPGQGRVEEPEDRGAGGRDLVTQSRDPAQTHLEERRLDQRAAARRDTTGGGGGLQTTTGGLPAWWAGAGDVILTAEQRAILHPAFDDSEVEIKYDGTPYIPWHRIWQRFLIAFAPYVPSVVPLSQPTPKESSMLMECVIVCNGQLLGHAWGECTREGGNSKMTIGNAIEGAMSDVVTRVGKRLGVGLQLWDPAYRDYWLATYAEQYRTDKGKIAWRKIATEGRRKSG